MVDRRSETWVKLVRTSEAVAVHLAMIQVVGGMVPVNEASLGSMFNGVSSDGDVSDPWMVTYPVMSELLEGRGYRLWDAVLDGEGGGGL